MIFFEPIVSLVRVIAAGASLILVPAGSFQMGSLAELDEQPIHRVSLAAFFIDRDEVTEGDYARCVADGACEEPKARDPRPRDEALPVTGVSWRDAAAYCEHLGKRLPTEAEWEKAARGPDGRTYPWGNSPNCGQANFGNFQGEGRCPSNPGKPVRVGSFPGHSPYGVRDLAGNVWEWVADRYDPRAYRHSKRKDPRGPNEGSTRVVRGGACCSMFGLPRSTNRLAFPEDYHDFDIGFRCARSLASSEDSAASK